MAEAYSKVTTPPQILAVRLERQPGQKPSLGCTFLLAVLLLAVAALAFYAGQEPGENSWVAYVVSGGFGFFGLLLLWAFIRQGLALGIPQTFIEVSEQPLRLNQPAKICLLQPGPVYLKSLRANLICMERIEQMVERNRDGRVSIEREVNEKMIYDQNLIDAKNIRVSAGDYWQELQTFSLPADVRPSVETDIETIYWRIEIWGKGRGLASFMHPYDVKVAN